MPPGLPKVCRDSATPAPAQGGLRFGFCVPAGAAKPRHMLDAALAAAAPHAGAGALDDGNMATACSYTSMCPSGLHYTQLPCLHPPGRPLRLVRWLPCSSILHTCLVCNPLSSCRPEQVALASGRRKGWQSASARGMAPYPKCPRHDVHATQTSPYHPASAWLLPRLFAPRQRRAVSACRCTCSLPTSAAAHTIQVKNGAQCIHAGAMRVGQSHYL